MEDDRRHKEETGEIENEIDEEKRQLEGRARRRDQAARHQYRGPAPRAEDNDAKGSQLSARREAQRDVDRITEATKRETDHLDEVLTAFKEDLSVKRLVADGAVYRSLRERFGDYFDGGMGAEAIKRLLQDLKLEEEADSLREQIATGKELRAA